MWLCIWTEIESEVAVEVQLSYTRTSNMSLRPSINKGLAIKIFLNLYQQSFCWYSITMNLNFYLLPTFDDKSICDVYQKLVTKSLTDILKSYQFEWVGKLITMSYKRQSSTVIQLITSLGWVGRPDDNVVDNGP